MKIILNKRQQIEEELALNRSKCEQQLLPAQQALLDSNSETDDYHARVRLDAVQTDITDSFRRLRGLVNEVKQIPNKTDPRVKAQIDFISEKVQRELQDYYRSLRDVDQRLRAQVRRRYEIVHPDATPEQIDSGMQSVIQGQEQIFQVLLASFSFSSGCRADTVFRSPAPVHDKPEMPKLLPQRDLLPSARLSRI